MKKIIAIAAIFVLSVFASCTPKAVEPAQESTDSVSVQVDSVQVVSDTTTLAL